MELKKQLEEITRARFGAAPEDCGDKQLCRALLELTNRLAQERSAPKGDRKLYYFSAEFLVLAPLDVLPAYQGKGIGAAILLELEKRAKILDYSFISILGHESYYPRFGYVPASQYQIQAPFEVPNENFMIKELIDGRLEGKSGVIQYSEAFN